MVFNDNDFKNLCVPIHNEEDVLENNKPLFKSMFGGLHKHRRVALEKMIKYIIYMYDIKSPMRQLFADVDERKKESAGLAGYDLDKDSVRLERIFNFDDRDISQMVTSFLKYQNNKSWAILQSNEEVLWQYHQELLKPITNFKQDKEKLQALDIKSKLMNECDAIIKRIESYEEKIYGQDKKLMQSIQSTPTSPEMVAYVPETQKE